MPFTDPSSYWKTQAAKASVLQSQLDAALSQSYEYKNQIERLHNSIDDQSDQIHQKDKEIIELNQKLEVMRCQIEDLAKAEKV